MTLFFSVIFYPETIFSFSGFGFLLARKGNQTSVPFEEEFPVHDGFSSFNMKSANEPETKAPIQGEITI